MPISKALHTIAVLLLLLTSAAAQAPRVTMVLDMKEFIEDWKISRQFTLDVANAMPAESYDFKASAEEMSFGQQMVHIARANVYRFNQISGVKPPFELDFNKQPPTDKASAMQMLEQSFDYVLAVLPQITPEQLQKTFHTDWKGRPDPDGRAMVLCSSTPPTTAPSARSICG